MYASRMNMKTAMIATMPGGLITSTHLVENWPGIKAISGPDLASAIVDHATSFGAKLINETAIDVERVNITSEDEAAGKKPGYVVKTSSGEYGAKTVLLATGSEHRHLGCPGEKEFENRGVSFCALCDAAFYRDKVVAVVGGGDSAAKEALLLSELCSKVYVISRTSLHPEPVNLERVKENSKIELIENAEVDEIIGDDKVNKIRLKDGKDLDVDGVFIAIGLLPNSELASKIGVELTDRGYIKVNRRSETNVPGVYAAGDVTDLMFKQAITGSAEAVTASFWAFEYLKHNQIIV